MELMRKRIIRPLLYLYVVLKLLFKRTRKVDNGCVLIIQGGNIGDALVDANSILSLAEYYTRNGKKVTVAGKKEVKNTLESILEIHTNTFDFFVIESSNLDPVKRTLSGLNKDGYEVIISLFPWDNWPSLYIPACLPCNESWGAFPEHDRRILKRILYRAFKNKIVVPFDMHQTQRSKLLAREIGISDFQTEIISIPPKDQRWSKDDNYIVISVDSTGTRRRWAAENFIELVRQLLKRYSYDIYLTGVNVWPNEAMEYEKVFGENDRVKIKVGKLCIDEWVETIRGSRFVVSIDSGTVHVAASVGATCFCLTGVWDGHRFMPYAVDKRTPGTKAPICVYRTDVNVEVLECYACLEKHHFGWGNKECAAQCRSGKPCLCLSKITVDDVMSVIEKAEHDGEIG